MRLEQARLDTLRSLLETYERSLAYWKPPAEDLQKRLADSQFEAQLRAAPDTLAWSRQLTLDRIPPEPAERMNAARRIGVGSRETGDDSMRIIRGELLAAIKASRQRLEDL